MSELFEAYPDMLTIEQVSHALNIGRSMAYRLVRSGEVYSLRFGTAIRVPKTALLVAVARKNEVADHGTMGGVSA